MNQIDWKKYPDILPDNGRKVLCVAYGKCMYIKTFEISKNRHVFYDGYSDYYCPQGEIQKVSHWAYLPDLPEN